MSKVLNNILEAAKNLELEQVLITSTSETYGTAQYSPIDENHPLVGQSPYSASKIAADHLAISYYRSFDLLVKIVRPFNTYGPRMRIKDGRAIPTFIAQALAGENITVFGTGNQTRSFCYISDLVDGIIRLMESSSNDPVNLGNPKEMTINAIAQQIVAMTGSRSQIIHRPLPIDDPKVRQPDITRARELLGWVPHVTIDEGLRRTIDYVKQKIG